MQSGTLWISKLTAQSDTYRAMVVPHDGSLPRAVILDSVPALRSFLSSVCFDKSVSDIALEQAKWRGFAILKRVSLAVFEAHAA